MNKLLLFTALACGLSITVFAQQGNNFKSFTKKQKGTSTPNLSFQIIPNTTNLKSISTFSYPNTKVSKRIMIPSLVTDKSIKNQVLESGMPIYFEKENSKNKNAKIETPEEHFYQFHNSTKTITRIKNPEKDFKIKNTWVDQLGITHIKAQQVYKGIDIYGAESYLHIGAQKDIFTGRINASNFDFDVIPKISEAEAISQVTADLTTKTSINHLSEKYRKLLDYSAPEVSLIIFENELAYAINIRPNFIEEWKYFINANTGEVLKHFNNTHSDGPVSTTAKDLNGVLRTIDTYLENGTYIMLNASEPMFNASTQEGIILTLDANNTSTVNLDYKTIVSANNTWNNTSAVSAHFNATKTYQYFKTTFNRNSINGKGGNILSFVNVADDDGGSMENAFWNGKAAFYGNGGSSFKPLAGALDVTAHELGHGVVSNSANLEYYGQSGAINETYADIFGSMVDRDDWLIGEDITRTTFSPSGALRNMANPHNLGTTNDNYWQPKHVSEMYIGNGDNGGVHINSGLGNHVYYRYATAVSKEKAEQVFYRALVYYLTSKSQFIDFRLAVVQSAKDLYGENSNEVTEANSAFDAVGIYEEEKIDYEQEYNENPGQDFLISYDTNEADQNTLYRSSTLGTDFYGLSKTAMKRKVCVSDDGEVAVFVSEDDKIKGVITDPNNLDEFYISNEAFWDNVTISKDGNLLAGISTEIDTAIYIYDFTSEKWAKFGLYNPTTSHDGQNAGGVLYADVIEFDHSGEFIIYDAYNELNSTTGKDISYWDIGFIRVWDKTKNSFADGNISKLYGSLPENVSIGNPTFSKNSPQIIAFDYLNDLTEEYGIFGANLLTGEVDLITTNATLGFPSFSKSDDKIAFSALDTKDNEVIGIVDLNINKISPAGSATILIEDAKWPVFYSVGLRNLELEPVTNFTVDIKSGNSPLKVQFIDLSLNNPTSWNWSFDGATPASSNQQNPTATYNLRGTYRVSLTSSNAKGGNTVTKTGYITVTSTVDAFDNKNAALISYYPNPTSGKLFVETNNEFRIKVFSQSGSLLIDKSNEKELDLSFLSSGIYFLKLEVNGEIITDKIVKQ